MAVEVGDGAPDFELKDQHGTPVKLSDFRGEKNVVLVFYPLAFSGVCSGELSRIRDELPTLGDDVEVLAHYQFPLLSDFWPHGETARRYGVFDEDRGVALRGTFIIDAEGVVRWKVVNAIPDARDVDEYSKALAEI